MPQSILIFDFGTNEEAAQQARHKIDAWKQGFRLGNKMLLKFERQEVADKDGGGAAEKSETPEKAEKPAKKAHGAAKAGKKKSAAKPAPKAEEVPPPESNGGSVRLFVRLDFSDHEKLSHQRWLDRIPTEEPFKSAKNETLRTGDPEFPKTEELFESLD